MKKLILMLSVLFIGIVSVSFVYSCSNKDEDELIINSNNENTTSLTNSTLSIGSNCNADCTGDQTPYCECDWGFASCGCRSATGNDKVGMMPSFSIQQRTLMVTYRSFLSSNGLENIAELVVEIENSINSNDVASYDDNVQMYINEIESLEDNQKILIQDWLGSNS